MSRALGIQAETAAADYLAQQGLILIERNTRSRWGEIDLVMRDREYWVFIEVKARTSSEYGSGLAAITPAKQQRIRRTAERYLTGIQQNHAWCRFDAVEIALPGHTCTWIRDAF